jgi:hypothetical protein
MGTTLTYTVFSLGEAQLHQLHTSQGKVRQALPASIKLATLTLCSVPSAALCDGPGRSGTFPRESHSISASMCNIRAIAFSCSVGWPGVLYTPHGLKCLCLQELRKGKFARTVSSARDVLHTIAELQLPVESTASTAGVTLLPAATVEGLLVDKRKLELVQPFKLALLKLASQVGQHAGLACSEQHSACLPLLLVCAGGSQAYGSWRV